MASTHSVGLYSNFLLSGFPRTFVSELAKAVPRFCYVWSIMNK